MSYDMSYDPLKASKYELMRRNLEASKCESCNGDGGTPSLEECKKCGGTGLKSGREEWQDNPRFKDVLGCKTCGTPMAEFNRAIIPADDYFMLLEAVYFATSNPSIRQLPEFKKCLDKMPPELQQAITWWPLKSKKS